MTVVHLSSAHHHLFSVRASQTQETNWRWFLFLYLAPQPFSSGFLHIMDVFREQYFSVVTSNQSIRYNSRMGAHKSPSTNRQDAQKKIFVEGESGPNATLSERRRMVCHCFDRVARIDDTPTWTRDQFT